MPLRNCLPVLCGSATRQLSFKSRIMPKQIAKSSLQTPPNSLRSSCDCPDVVCINAARRHFFDGIGQIHQRLSEQLADHPAALAAAISELVTFVRFSCYFDAVILEYQPRNPSLVCEAVFQSAMKRAQIWIFNW